MNAPKPPTPPEVAQITDACRILVQVITDALAERDCLRREITITNAAAEQLRSRIDELETELGRERGARRDLLGRLRSTHAALSETLELQEAPSTVPAQSGERPRNLERTLATIRDQVHGLHETPPRERQALARIIGRGGG